MWSVNVRSLKRIVCLQVGVEISVQRFAMRSVRTGGHSCAYIVQMMPRNIVMRLLTGSF